MFQGKKGPYLLIITLVVTLFFVLGVQYGKQVERTDKTNRYIMNLKPSIISPTAKIPVHYELFSNSGCGLSFLYPSTLSVQNESSSQAELKTKDSTESINIYCSEKKIPEPKGASSESTLDSNQSILYLDGNQAEYRVRNNKNNLVRIIMSKEFIPLINKSLLFID